MDRFMDRLGIMEYNREDIGKSSRLIKKWVRKVR